MAEMKRAWLYGRADGLELSTQMEYIRYWAMMNGYTIVGETAEINSRLRSNGCAKVIEAMRENRMDVLIVKDLGQLPQAVADVSQWIEMLHKNGVDLISITDGYDLDLPAIRFVA